MATRTRTPLPFGAGLDRESGAIVVDAQNVNDLRNVHLTRGRATLRKGLSRAALIADAGVAARIIGIHPVNAATGHEAVVTFNPATGHVWIYLVENNGGSVVTVGFLWGVPTGATTPPRVSVAEAYNTLVIAHDEPVYAYRQPTITFDVATRVLDILRADFAGPAGDQSIYFRGVARHLNYVVGWGFGVDGDEDRPETFRISMPGEPTNFVAEHYFNVGVRGDPIVGGARSGNVFKIMKSGESHDLIGYDRSTFGVRPADPNFGLVGSQAHVTVVDELFVWAVEGPRVFSGAGASADLELPLDLDGPTPDALADATAKDYTFAYYDKAEGEVVFVMGRWAYVLHMKDDQRRWSYRQFAIELASAGLVYAGGTAPSIALAADPDADGGVAVDPTYIFPSIHPSLTVNWLNVGTFVGDEKAEVWVRSQRPSGNYGVWTRKAIVDASDLTATTDALHDFLTDHDVAIRYTRFGTPDPQYISLDPTAWPALAQQVQQTGGTITSFILGPWVASGGGHTAPLTYLGPGKDRTNAFGNEELDFVYEKNVNAAGWVPAQMMDGGAGGHPLSEITLAGLVSGDSVQIRMRVVGPDATTADATSLAQVVP